MTTDDRRRLNRKAMRQAKWAAMTPAERLAKAGTKLLAKHGYFPKREAREESLVEADGIGQNGRLRPTWTGRP